MPDPITNSAITTAGTQLAGGLIYKILVFCVGPIAASVVVLLMMPPKTASEFISSLISTVFCSVGLGAYVISHYFADMQNSDITTAALTGAIYFGCGLPGWFVVKALFFTMEKSRNKTIFDIFDEIRHKGGPHDSE